MVLMYGIIFVVIVFCLLVTVFSGIFVVDQQTVAIVEMFGKYYRTYEAGLNFKFPWITIVAERMTLKIQQLKEEVVAKTKDNVFVKVPVNVQYQVIGSKAKDAYYVLKNVPDQISAYIKNTIRSSATGMTLEEVFQNTNTFELQVKETLEKTFSEYGYEIISVLVDNPVPSKEIVESFDKVVASKRLLEAATNEAEATRVKTVAHAKAEAESLTLKATAYVEQRKSIAEGMEQFMTKEEIMSYLVGIDYRDTIREASQNGSVILMPVEMQNGSTAETLLALKALKGAK